VSKELVMAVISFANNEHSVARGLQLPPDHELVQRYPKYFIPVSAGDEAAIRRARDIEHATEAIQEKQRAELRAARIATGTRFAADDDAYTEQTKRQVRSNSDLELVRDPETGLVTGFRTKPAIAEAARERAEKAEQSGDSLAAQSAAEFQRRREA
jgi:hypothetical protein